MDEKLMKKIYRIHIKQLKYLDVPHKKFAICFSGIAGSGKTYIAKILEERYKGVRIRNDDIRKIAVGINAALNKDAATYDYLNWLVKNYSAKNKLIILDSGIDRNYNEKFSLMKREGYEIFVIRVKASRETYEKRIIKKLGKLDDNYFERSDDWRKQYKEFGRNVKPDILIENGKDNELDLNSLFEKLDRLIR